MSPYLDVGRVIVVSIMLKESCEGKHELRMMAIYVGSR